MMKFGFDFKIIEDTFCVYRCPVDWIVEETATAFHRLYFVHSGTAFCEYENKKIKLENGHLYLFPTNKPYRITHDRNDPFVCLWFHIIISPVLFNSVIGFKVEKEIEQHLIQALQFAVYEHVLSGNGQNLVHQILHGILYLVSLKHKFIFCNNPKLNEVISYIQQHYMEDINNDKLSKMLGYDTGYFIRWFEKLMGITPKKYVTSIRITKAIEHIRSNKTIYEVAEMTGYTDEKAFSRAFKREKGVPPISYKKSDFIQL
jgi:AraC-like DNA-binding protein